MGATMIEPSTNHHSTTMTNFSTTKPLKVCFSYAAYAKNLICHLHSLNIPVEEGLSEEEFAAVESCFDFTFPPDLRSILREGLPVGPGFPNWRHSSKQQLEIQMNLPVLGILEEVSRSGLWMESWGEKPLDLNLAAKLANGFLKSSPPLVPIYRNFYMPSRPCMAGNPVFYVHGGGDVRLWSFDISGFFQQVEFNGGDKGASSRRRTPTLSELFSAPAWAATEARRIEFWTEAAETGRRCTAALGATRGWWSGDDLEVCLEEVCWRLRDGGWGEEDVREMVMMDGCDVSEIDLDEDGSWDEVLSRERVERRVRLLSGKLLRGGWSTEDVVETLGCVDEDENEVVEVEGESSCFDFHYKQICDDLMKHENNSVCTPIKKNENYSVYTNLKVH